MTHLSKETLVTLEHAQQRVSRMLESKNHIRHEWLKEQSKQAQKGDTQNIHKLASVVRKRLHLFHVVPEPKHSNPG